MTEQPNIKKSIKVNELTSYLEEISDIRAEIKQKGENKRLFSRGQENINWDIQPTVFRGSLLKDESKMIQKAYARNPSEFRNYVSPFERLTKLQHYGLSTRLLDVTLNPMVALYFACQDCNERMTDRDICNNQISKESNPSGIVYCQLDFGYSHNSPEVGILSAISEMDMEDMTLKSCLQKLKENGTLSASQFSAYLKNDYKEFIKIIRGNYFVISNFSNERLIRQSGAFLLPGCINIKWNEDHVEESPIQKAKDSLIDEFTSRRFEIPADAKSNILDELDMYNINEASLFPELEHQMRYIKSIHQNNTIGMVDNFSRLNLNSPPKIPQDDTNNTVPKFQDDDEGTKKLIKSSVYKWTPPGVSKDVIYKIFEDNLVIDWYKKDQVLSKIRTEINRSIENSERYTPDGSEKWANVIVNMVIQDLGKWDEVIKENNAKLGHKED